MTIARHFRSTAGDSVRAAEPEFLRALQLMHEIQAVGTIGMRVEKDKAGGSTGVVFFRREDKPEAHLKEQSAAPALLIGSTDGSDARVRIHSGREKPATAFAALHYRDHWFWVDDRDWITKRAMTAIMFFFTLTDTPAPVKSCRWSRSRRSSRATIEMRP